MGISTFLASLDQEVTYRDDFVHAQKWQPYVLDICQRHGLVVSGDIHTGLAGSFPTFIVDGKWVVKLFGRLFDGEASYQAEVRANQLVDEAGIIPHPRLCHTGSLFAPGESGTWHWPYLVFEYLDGVSFGEVYSKVSRSERLRMAGQMGCWVRALHTIRLPSIQGRGSGDDRCTYLTFLQRQITRCHHSHSEWGSIPTHLIAQIEDYILPVERLMPGSYPPHLIHADLTGDHLLGRLEVGTWQSLGIIDWGDAMPGDLFYELQALYLDLFRCDREMLSAFLEAYDLQPEQKVNFSRRAMCLTLLHQFDVFVAVKAWRPELLGSPTLDDLESSLWQL